MGYDRGDSFPFVFEPNEITFQIRKENCHHDHIPFNLLAKGNIVFSAYTPAIEKWFTCHLLYISVLCLHFQKTQEN